MNRNISHPEGHIAWQGQREDRPSGRTDPALPLSYDKELGLRGLLGMEKQFSFLKLWRQLSSELH